MKPQSGKLHRTSPRSKEYLADRGRSPARILEEIAMSQESSGAARNYPVIIIGAGPVGLALGNDLAWRGIPCLLIEQRTEPLNFPTGESVHARTMEHLRRLDLADEVRAGFPLDMSRNVNFVTRLKGYDLGRVDRPSNREQQRLSGGISPEGPVWCSRLQFETILTRGFEARKKAQLLPGHEVTEIMQDGCGVAITVRNVANGEQFDLGCQYLAGCDGGAGSTRKALGIAFEGTFAEGRNLTIYFRSDDVRRLMESRGGVMADIVNPDINANLSAVNGNDLWRLLIFVRDQDPARLDPHRCIRLAVGDDVAVEILGTRVWAGHTVVAERYRKARVFLAGDAAHLIWPRGGFGMNTGIGDAVDLAWKLDGALTGWGGSHLLESYEAERRPVAIRNSAEAARNYHSEASLEVSPDLEKAGPVGEAKRAELARIIHETRSREWNTLGLQLGYRYQHSPICWEDISPGMPVSVSEYQPTTEAGARAPHLWLAPGESILDHFGRGFCLVHRAGSPDPEAFMDAASERRMPLTTLALQSSVHSELYEKAFVLVRPDGHVAWRGDAVPKDSGMILDRARGAAGPEGQAAL